MFKKLASQRSRVAITLMATLTAVAGLAGSASTGAATPASFDWPVFHNSTDLAGTSADPGISTANAATLGVRWMVPVGTSVSSPVIANNAALGRTLAYVGTLSGYFTAVDADTGQIVWSDNLGVSVYSSPLVEGNNVWVATKSGFMYKLNAATGATVCTAAVKGGIQGTPVIGTPPGGTTTIYLPAVGNGPTGHGLMYAFAEGTCLSQNLFKFKGYPVGVASGAWDPLSYAVSAHGEGLLLWGSKDPDAQVYAVDAITGVVVWHFQTLQGADWDVGAGVTTSAPGVNGFADGAAYVDGKDGILYALDLTTGQLLWSWNFGGNGPGLPVVQTNADTTPALSGSTLVFATSGEVYAVNAMTGALLWQRNEGKNLINIAPAIVGPAGQQVVGYGTFNGVFHLISLNSGTLVNPSLYAYKTGSFLNSSVADHNGNLYFVGGDGFLYDFAPGGGNGSTPTTGITSPASGSSVPNPGPNLVISGTASAADGVSSVTVEVERGVASGARWYDQSSSTYGPGIAVNTAVLATPGATSTTWTISIPVPTAGAPFTVFASAVGANGVADTVGQGRPPTTGQSAFTVLPL